MGLPSCKRAHHEHIRQLQLGVLAVLELLLNLEHAWAVALQHLCQLLRGIFSGSLVTYDETCQASNCSCQSCLTVLRTPHTL